MDKAEEDGWAKKDPVFRLLVRNEGDDRAQNGFRHALHIPYESDIGNQTLRHLK